MTSDEMTLFELDIERFHALLRSGETTCAALVDYYLARIEKFDKQINSVICLNPNARKEATEKDVLYKAKGLQGELFGVPVLLKDCINTADMPTTSASLALKNLQPEEDALVVKKLRAAGAIILAKVNLSELACSGETLGSLIGQTRNPYDPGYTVGGSSGGTGAGLTADFGLVGLGTDAMNSVRSPSSACSLVGIRPSRGLVGRSGSLPHAFTHDTIGVLARSVKDVATTLDVICGYDSEDPITAWGAKDCGGYKAALDKVSGTSLKGWRLGVVRSLIGKSEASAEVTALTEVALNDLAKLGAYVEDFAYQIDMDELQNEVNVQFHEQDRDISTYLEKYAHQTGIHNLTELVESGKVSQWIINSRLQKSIGEIGRLEEYHRRLVNIQALREKIADTMVKQQLDALIYPMQQQLVAKIGCKQLGRNGLLCAAIGFPALVVPVGFSAGTKTAPLGVPVGIEFVGWPFTEKKLFELAFTYEQATHHRKSPILK